MFIFPGKIRITQQTPALCKQTITKAIISIISLIFSLKDQINLAVYFSSKDQINLAVRFSKTIAG